MGGSTYRSSNIIIQNILETIMSAQKNGKGIVKSHLINKCGLKVSTADKYLSKMEKAGYIRSYKEPWGDRERIIYELLPLGRERYEWFVKINSELE